MFQNCALAEKPKRTPEYRRVLFDNAGERNHINNSTQTVCNGVIQCKGKGCQGFSTTRRHSQGEKPGVIRRFFTNINENIRADFIDIAIGLECGQMPVQFDAKFIQ